MFVVTGRDIQTKLKEIRNKVLSGEEAIIHGSGGEDMVMVSQDRYNQLIKLEKEKYQEILSKGETREYEVYNKK